MSRHVIHGFCRCMSLLQLGPLRLLQNCHWCHRYVILVYKYIAAVLKAVSHVDMSWSVKYETMMGYQCGLHSLTPIYAPSKRSYTSELETRENLCLFKLRFLLNSLMPAVATQRPDLCNLLVHHAVRDDSDTGHKLGQNPAVCYPCYICFVWNPAG